MRSFLCRLGLDLDLGRRDRRRLLFRRRARIEKSCSTFPRPCLSLLARLALRLSIRPCRRSTSMLQRSPCRRRWRRRCRGCSKRAEALPTTALLSAPSLSESSLSRLSLFSASSTEPTP